jgi:hypothetical protein
MRRQLALEYPADLLPAEVPARVLQGLEGELQTRCGLAENTLS